MNIAIMCHDNKRELVIHFCAAYVGILKNHYVCATDEIAKAISKNTGLLVDKCLAYDLGGVEQICSRLSCGELDLVLFFRDINDKRLDQQSERDIIRLCDLNNIPLGTNMGTSEALIHALDRGDLDWRKVPRYM